MNDKVNPVHVEGSAARARERGAFGPHSIPEGDASLATPTTVEALVRGFLSDAMATRSGYLRGEIEPAKAAEIVVADAKRVQAIFYGEEPGYQTTEWNRSDRLGKFIVDHGAECEPDEAVASLLYAGFKEIAAAGDEGAEERLNDDMVEATVDDVVARCVTTLLGIPMEAFTSVDPAPPAA